MQKPTKAFADMVLEIADRLEAVLNEVYGDAGLIPVFVSPESLRDMAREFTPDAERGELAGDSTSLSTRFEPLHPITMYRAGCTSCGTVVDDYGDYSCMDDDAVVRYVCESLGWFEVTRDEPSPTPEIPTRVIVHTVELLCPDCQRCEVCRANQAYEIDDHLVCEDHEDHNFHPVGWPVSGGA